MQDRLGAGEQGIDRLKRALFEGDAEGLREALETFTTRVLSYHDLMVRKDRAGDDTLPVLRVYPEQVIHVFVLGLLATLEPEYEVRSNRESGGGRPDVMIRARGPGKPAFDGKRVWVRSAAEAKAKKKRPAAKRAKTQK